MRNICLVIAIIILPICLRAQPNINYYTIGEGKPILIINGGPGWSSNHMKPVAKKISKMGYEAILYDQRGTGESSIKPDTSTIKLTLMVEDIEKIRREKNIKSWIVYGHSFGGMLAMKYASEYPKRIEKLILSAPGGVDLSFLDYNQTNLNYNLSDKEKREIKKWSDPAKINENPGLASYNIIKNTIPSYLFNKKYEDSLLSKIHHNTWNILTSNLVFQDLYNNNYDLKPTLHKIKAPTLIIQGRQDALGEQNPLTISRLIPNSELEIVEKSAHIMWLDRPTRYFNRIEEFLTESTTYTLVDPKVATKILAKMKGEKKLQSRILGEEGYINFEGKAIFENKLDGIEETANVTLNNKKISVRAYIKYSQAYERFELVQIDNIAYSFIIMHGLWDSQTNTLKFKPIKNYSQWGSIGTLELKWNYEFYEDGSFKKVMKIPNQSGEWVVQSDYHYMPTTSH